MATTASIGTVDKKYVSALGMDTREWLPALLDVNNDEYLTDLLEISKRYRKTSQPIYSNWVADALFILMDTTGATVTGSGTATIGTTLTAITSGYARKTDLIMFPSGSVGYVTNVTTSGGQDTLTIVSVDGTNITHTAGQKLTVFSEAVGEKSLKIPNRRYGNTLYSNKVQEFRERNSITDIAAASEVEIPYNGSVLVFDRDVAIKALQFKAWINAAFIGGRMSVTNFSDASPALVDPIGGGAVQTTRGLDQYVTTYGINDSVAVAGSWSFADLDDTIGRIMAVKGMKNYILIRPTLVALAMDKYLQGITTGISSGQLNLSGSSFEYGVTNLTYGGYRFQMPPAMGFMDHQEFFSQTNMVKSMYGIPTDQVKTFGSGVQPRFSARWMPHNVQVSGVRGDEMWAEWDTGAMARNGANSDEMVRDTHWISIQGLEILGAQHFFKVQVLA